MLTRSDQTSRPYLAPIVDAKIKADLFRRSHFMLAHSSCALCLIRRKVGHASPVVPPASSASPRPSFRHSPRLPRTPHPPSHPSLQLPSSAAVSLVACLLRCLSHPQLTSRSRGLRRQGLQSRQSRPVVKCAHVVDVNAFHAVNAKSATSSM